MKYAYEQQVTPENNKKAESIWSLYQEKLDKKNIWFAKDAFENNGPDFGCTGNNDELGYYLKVLKKDPKGHYRVYELKEYSNVAQYLPKSEYTYRVYCKEQNVSDAKGLIE